MEEKELINPLQRKTVVVRFIKRPNSISTPGHLLKDGMAEGCATTLTVPIISSTGSLKNVLTNEEKSYFEEVLGVNLSVHNKVNNYWKNYKVRLTKNDTILDLSNPDDYIKYKVLLANNNLVCPSLQSLNERHLATYKYVITSPESELAVAVDKRKMRNDCFKMAGKIENDFETLKAVVELLDKRPVADTSSIEFLANKLDEFIDTNTKEVYRILTDDSLKTMIFLRKCASKGLIVKSGDFYYLKSGRTKVPMCEEGRDPDINNAVKFINNPKNQEIKFSLEAGLSEVKAD